MAISKKDRKQILKNYPEVSIKELSRRLGVKPQEIREVLESAGRKIVEPTAPLPAEKGLLGYTPASLLGVMIIITVISVIYLNSIRNGFHYDDIHSLLQNFGVRVEWVKDPETRKLFWRYFVEPELFSSRPRVGMPRPLLMDTFGFNYMISAILCDKYEIGCEDRGYDPRGWILLNILLHVFNSIIVYVGLCHLSGKRRIALLTALLFAAHPINTETVNYINCRSESLGAFFMLLTMYFFVRSLRDDKTWMMIFSFITFALGLLTKEMVFVLPALLAWIDLIFVYPTQRDKAQLLDRVLKWYLPLVALMALYMVYRYQVMEDDALGRKVRSIPDNLLTQSRVLVTYIRQLFVPAHQNISYENTIYTVGEFIHKPMITLKLFSCILTLAVTGALGLIWYRKHPVISFTIATFFVTLSITSLIPLNAIMNEHRLYLASMAVSLLIASFLYRMAEYYNERDGRESGAWPIQIQALTVVIFLSFVSLTVARNFTWHTDHSVWMDSVQKSPTKAQVVSDLGNAFYRTARNYAPGGQFTRDQYIDNKERMEIAQVSKVDIPEGATDTEVNRKLFHLYERGLRRAEQLYLWAIRVEWDYYKAWHNLGTINYTFGSIEENKRNTDKAIDYYKRAIYYFQNAVKIVPNGESFNDMASTYLKLSEMEQDRQKQMEMLKEAEKNYRKGIRYNPELQKAYLNLALILQRLGRPEEGLPFIEQAIQINRADGHPHFIKGLIMRELRRYPEAIKSFKDCLYYSPGNSQCEQKLRETEEYLQKQGAPPPSP